MGARLNKWTNKTDFSTKLSTWRRVCRNNSVITENNFVRRCTCHLFPLLISFRFVLRQWFPINTSHTYQFLSGQHWLVFVFYLNYLNLNLMTQQMLETVSDESSEHALSIVSQFHQDTLFDLKDDCGPNQDENLKNCLWFSV